MSRILAHLVDAAVIALVPTVLALGAVMFHLPVRPLELTPFIVVACLAQAVWQVANGRSFGKWLVGLRVTQSNGRPAGALQVILVRNVGCYLLYGACGIAGLVDLIMFLTPPHRRLHDRVAGTFVVEDPRV